MKAYVQVQFRTDTGLVGKLSYRAKGSYIITKDLGNNPFKVQRYSDESSATRKYKNTELYLLPPALFPSVILDTMDQRYLDCNNSPIVSPLLKLMQIELYNEKWLYPNANPLNSYSCHRDQPSNEIDSFSFMPHADIHIHTVTELNGDPPPTP